MSSKRGINYVIACYFGERHFEHASYTADCSFFIRKHLESLLRLEHDLDQITVVVNGEAPAWLYELLPSSIRGTLVRLMERPNVGLSYGAYSDAFALYGDSFDYFILTEDDYIFTHDRFDSLLLDELESRPDCGMLCGATYSYPDGKFAAVSIAICRSEALKAAQKNGQLYYLDSNTHPGYDGAYYSQKQQSFDIQKAGYKVEDWLLLWSTAYWESESRRVYWFGRNFAFENPEHVRGNFSRRSMIVPIQCLGVEDQVVFDRVEDSIATIDERGVIGGKL